MSNLNNLFWIWFFLMFTDLHASTGASPSLNSQCQFQLSTPPNGTGVVFNESCTIAYVLPPKTGQTELRSLARNTNLQFCPAVKSVGQVASRTINAMNIIGQKIEQMIQNFEPLEQTLLNTKLELSSAKNTMESAKKRFEDAESHIKNLRQIVRESRQAFEDCVDDESADNTSCIELKTVWDEAKQEVSNFRSGEYRDCKLIVDDATEAFDLISSRFKVISNRYTEAISPMIELQDQLFDLNSKVMALYREYVKLEGTTGQITWSIAWDRLLEDYKHANRGLSINWQRMPIKEAELVATIKNGELGLELSSLSAVKYAIIPGAKPTGFAGMGTGQKVEGSQLAPSFTSQASSVFGNSISGQIILTLAGACPYFDGIEERTYLDINELTKNMTANLMYTFEIAARRSYVASYNLSSMLHLIEKKTKEGGLFSTSVSHSIIDDADSMDWFSISFAGNSAQFQYTPEEQKQITKEVKEELFDKSLSKNSPSGSEPFFITFNT